MTLSFPSPEFEYAVAAVCHGSASEVEMQALNGLLRSNAAARDAYLLQVELHTRLASEPDLFAQGAEAGAGGRSRVLGVDDWRGGIAARTAAPTFEWRWGHYWALAASLVLLGAGIWSLWLRRPAPHTDVPSTAVAMLTRVVDARWDAATETPRVGSALKPGRFGLAAGLAQVVFYSGARVVIEGPADLQLVSPNEAVLSTGRLLAEVPPAAPGFRLKTGGLDVVDLGTEFGLAADRSQSEVHVFKGKVEWIGSTGAKGFLAQGQAAVVQGNTPLRLVAANAAAFTPLFEFQQRSLASEAFRYKRWQFASAQLNQDPSLVVRLDFENRGGTDWTLRNTAEQSRAVVDATIVGCQRAEGRWREKESLEFRSVNDRVRLAVPGEYESLTLSAWVRVAGLDRQFNSLFMCDAFDAGTIHWLIRGDGVLGLTVFGANPGEYQILASPPVLGPEEFGLWLYLAVVVDGQGGRVVHYVNGVPVSQHALKLGPPFRIGPVELGNWNTRGAPNPEPKHIRNFSGAFDEFLLFNRALAEAEIRDLCVKGRPEP